MNPDVVDFMQWLAVPCSLVALALAIAISLFMGHLRKKRAARLQREQARKWMRGER